MTLGDLDGDGGFSNTFQSLGINRSNEAALADLDGDDDLDAVVANGGDGGQGNTIWTNSGDGDFTLHGDLFGDAQSTSLALGDLAGDGDNAPDAFVANNGANTVWRNTPSAGLTRSGAIGLLMGLLLATVTIGRAVYRRVAPRNATPDNGRHHFPDAAPKNEAWPLRQEPPHPSR